MSKDTTSTQEDKGFDIIVNGRTHTIEDDEVTFDEVVDLAYPEGGRGELISYTVLFYEGGGRVQEGRP